MPRGGRALNGFAQRSSEKTAKKRRESDEKAMREAVGKAARKRQKAMREAAKKR